MVWQLPVNEDNPNGEYGGCSVHPNVKYHCFKNAKSLCGKYQQVTDYWTTEIESGEILANPQFACKACRRKWMLAHEMFEELESQQAQSLVHQGKKRAANRTINGGRKE